MLCPLPYPEMYRFQGVASLHPRNLQTASALLQDRRSRQVAGARNGVRMQHPMTPVPHRLDERYRPSGKELQPEILRELETQLVKTVSM
jgi:hypothetical protein